MSNIVDTTYFNIFDHILDVGSLESNRTGVDTISLFGVSYRLPVSESAFPIVTHKKIIWKSLVAELIWYIKGESHIRNLRHHTKIWNAWADEDGNLETAYGRFWRYYPAFDFSVDELDGQAFPNLEDSPYGVLREDSAGFSALCFDQLSYLIGEFKKNPRSRRLHLTAWYPPNATVSKLPPCHHSFTLNYQNGRLNLHLTQRSSDHCIGNPFNLSCYSLLLILICRELQVVPGEFYHSITDAHVYVNHIDAYKDVSRETYPLPQLDLSELGDKSLFDLDYEDIEKIKLIGYQSGPLLKLPVAV
jgi:thymidylate synthase